MGEIKAKTKTRHPRTYRKIVFIGPDCSGKSTLAQLYSEYADIPVLANRRMESTEELIQHLNSFTKELVQADASFICDQFQFPVDHIYSRALGLESTLRQAHMKSEVHLRNHQFSSVTTLVDAFRVFDVLLVYVTASPEELEKRYNERGDELWDINQIKTVAKEYEKYFEENPHSQSMVRIDTTDKTPEEVLKAAVLAIDDFYSGEYKE